MRGNNMKTKARHKITSLLLAFALAVGMVAVPSTALTASAVEIKSGMPDIKISTHNITQTTTTIGFGGKEWVVIGYNGTGINSEADTMTLLLKQGSSSNPNTYGLAQFDSTNPYSNHYDGSDLKTAMNNAADTVSPGEKLLIESVDLAGGSANGGGTISDDKMAGAGVNAQLFWPLSVYEANAIHANERGFSGFWWLRSAGDYDFSAPIVRYNGYVDSLGFVVSNLGGIRPALKINLPSVIFSSSNLGGKPTQVGANLSAALQPTGAIKLTVKDSALAGFTAVPTGINGNSITLDYSGVGTTANRISAVVKDNSGEITHVGMLVSAPAANGTTTVALPSGFDPANDKLYIFAETVNLPNYTDYASNLVEVPVQAQSNAPIGLVGVPCTDASNNDGKITGLTTDMEYSTDNTNWAVVTGTELTGLSAGNYMVRYKQVYGNTVYLQNPSTTITVGTYTPLGTVATPTANPAGGQVTAGTTITLNVAESGATIHYTIDGSTPTTTSPVYSTPISVNSAMTIKAVAVKAGMTDSVIMNESYTIASTPPASTNYIITLGASGDGTVSGGGSYAENTTATVTATPNIGWSFVQWTEGDTVVNTNASYSFTVTAARTLTAEFEEVPPTPTPPSYTGGRSSSSGGTSKPDVAPVTGRAFTKPEATRLFNKALTAKPEGQTTISIKARNYTKVDKSVLAELVALAEKNGVTLTVHFDTVVNKVVTYRISVNPAMVTTNLDLTIKIVGGKLTMPKFPAPVEVAVKLPDGLTLENLKITQSGKDITKIAKPWLDKNGYLHFTTTGGEIVLGK